METSNRRPPSYAKLGAAGSGLPRTATGAATVLAATIATACAAQGASASGIFTPFRVLSLDEVRSAPCGESSYAFATGVPSMAARDALLDPANFGLGGIIGRSATIVEPVGAINEITLQNADLVFVNSLAFDPDDPVLDKPLGFPNNALSEAEQAWLALFVEQGGGVLVFANQGTNNVSSFLGCSPAIECGPGLFFFVESDHPVIDGPFGSNTGLFSIVFHCRVESLGRFGVPIAESNLPMAAAFQYGAGRIVVVNDDEWMMNTTTGCFAFRQWGEKARTLFLNSVAWMLPEPGFQFTPPCPFPVEDLNCDGIVNGADLGILLSQWGPCDGCSADFDGDGEIDGADLGVLLAAWTATSPR
ncbi:MAG TPA: hypothetical protein PKC43_14195 [Phycisphaerales bacterium]|nr:hypothetical protein [Phycisphaerales bacterium]HMP38584.1 hypothetical protein [Phycisphaerales bacterium]